MDFSDSSPSLVTSQESPLAIFPKKKISYEFFHELSPESTEASSQTKTFSIKPSRHATFIKVKSTVVGGAAARLSSPSYLSSIRRKKVAVLVGLVESLAQHAGRDDFVVFTHPVVEKIRDLLECLRPAKFEGNTRQILRYVRDSFLNGGWENIRAVKSRQSIVEILNTLKTHEEITANDANEAFDKMFEAGLDPVAAPGLYYDLDSPGQAENVEE